MLISFKVLINFDTWCLQISLNNSSAQAAKVNRIFFFNKKPFLFFFLDNFFFNATFSEVDVAALVFGTARGLEVIHKSTDGAIAGCDKVNGFHGWNRFTFLIQIFNHCTKNPVRTWKMKSGRGKLTGDSFSSNFMHFAAGRHHPHGKLINQKNAPINAFLTPRCLPIWSDDILHNLWRINNESWWKHITEVCFTALN